MNFNDNTKNRKILLILSSISLVGLLIYLLNYFFVYAYSQRSYKLHFVKPEPTDWIFIVLTLALGVAFFLCALFHNKDDIARRLRVCLSGVAALFFGGLGIRNLIGFGERIKLLEGLSKILSICNLLFLLVTALFFGFLTVVLISKPEKYAAFQMLAYCGSMLVIPAVPTVLKNICSFIGVKFYLGAVTAPAYYVALAALFVGIWIIGKEGEAVQSEQG